MPTIFFVFLITAMVTFVDLYVSVKNYFELKRIPDEGCHRKANYRVANSIIRVFCYWFSSFMVFIAYVMVKAFL